MDRNKIIDIMKGIGIFLVVFAHTLKNNNLIGIIYIFHMPLFFILSGYLYKYDNKTSYIFYIKKKFKTIMIPYFVFSILSLLYWIIIENRFRGLEININIIKNIFSNIFLMKIDKNLFLPNIVLWFLPCIFLSNLFFFFIKKIDARIIRILVSTLLFSLGYILNLNKIILPFAFETILIVMIYIEFGFEMSKINLKDNKIKVFILSIILLVLSILFNRNINILEHTFGNPILFITGAIGGTGVVYMISLILSKKEYFLSIFQQLGLYSMGIMLIHEPLKRIIIFVLSKLLNVNDLVLRKNIIICLFITAIVIIISIPFVRLINKYIPFIIGKRKLKD